MFENRIDAAQKLAEELKLYKDTDCIILGIPRGGAIVAYHVARELNTPWDIIIPRKIGAPFNHEVAIGAVSQDGKTLINKDMIDYYKIPYEYIDRESREQLYEVKRRLNLYRGNSKFPDVEGKTVILVDDGIATGFTAAAAIGSIKNHNAGEIIVGVPVASIEAITMLSRYCNEVVCIESPGDFLSVGSSYMCFNQNTDDEIIGLFKQSNTKTFV